MRLRQALEGNFCFDNHLNESVDPGADDLSRAAELLYSILNESTRYAYDALELEDNGSTKRITTLYHECVDLMKKAAIGGEKTAFLSMSILEGTFRKTFPMCLVHLQSILDGSSHMVEQAKELQAIFARNPYKKNWEAKSGEYRELLARIGLEPDDADYSDLTKIMDPLLNALTFYPAHVAHCKVYRFRIREEPMSATVPAFSLHVSKFRSESDLVNAIMGCGKPNAVCFAAIEKTYGDTEDWFETWYQGQDGERMRNVMRNDRIDRDAYLSSIDTYSRTVYLCAKAGGDLYLIPMPYGREAYGGSATFSDDNKYYYGKRAGYAPYQIFYDEPPAAPQDTTFLAVPRKGWLLSELMDADQKAWLPPFLAETFDYFYKHGDVPAEDCYLPEERAIVAPDGTTYRNPVPETAIVPISTAISAVRLTKEIPEPEDCFDKPYVSRLLRTFGIGPSDVLANSEKILSGSAMKPRDWDARIRMAYLKLLCDAVQASIAERAGAEWQVKELLKDKQAVMDRVISGACDGFTTVLVNGRMDEKGNVEKTYASDGTPQRNNYHGFTVMWYGKPTTSAPPVVWQVRPCAAEDYAALLGLPVGGLVAPLKYYTDFQSFWTDYQHAMPHSMSYNGTVRPRDFLRLNLCMTKTEYKKILKEKETASRKRENPENAKDPENMGNPEDPEIPEKEAGIHAS